MVKHNIPTLKGLFNYNLLFILYLFTIQLPSFLSRKVELYNNHQSQRTVQHSIDWLEAHVLYRLEVEGRKENTFEGYWLAFRALKAIYGGEYSVLKIERAAVSAVQRHLHE